MINKLEWASSILWAERVRKDYNNLIKDIETEKSKTPLLQQQAEETYISLNTIKNNRPVDENLIRLQNEQKEMEEYKNSLGFLMGWKRMFYERKKIPAINAQIQALTLELDQAFNKVVNEATDKHSQSQLLYEESKKKVESLSRKLNRYSPSVEIDSLLKGVKNKKFSTMAFKYYTGNGYTKSLEQAHYWANKAIKEEHDHWGFYLIGCMYRQGEIEGKISGYNFEESESTLVPLAIRNFSPAQVELGLLYHGESEINKDNPNDKGCFIPKYDYIDRQKIWTKCEFSRISNKSLANEWFKIAADNGDSDGYYYLGVSSCDSWRSSVDSKNDTLSSWASPENYIKEARDFLRKAKALGHSNASITLTNFEKEVEHKTKQKQLTKTS